MTRAAFSPVLRHPSIEEAPRPLRRDPSSARSVVAPWPIATIDPAVERLRADAVRQGHAEGHALGVEEGRQAGLAEGRTAALERDAAALRAIQEDADRRCEQERARIDGAVERLQSIEQELRENFDAARRAGEEDAIAAAWSAICRLVGEASEDRERTSRIVRTAVAVAGDAAPLVVRLHPEDAAVLAAGDRAVDTSGIEWVPDATIHPGGCIVSHARGRLDARLDRQLAVLREAWLQSAGPSEGAA